MDKIIVPIVWSSDDEGEKDYDIVNVIAQQEYIKWATTIEEHDAIM